VNVKESYDSAARAYAEQLYRELDGKPLDRHLLNRFAESVRDKGLVADLGCGPGHVARYLSEQGVEVCGIDLSPEMVRIAREMSPSLDFRAGDMMALELDDESLAGIVAFYSIVHFDSGEISAAFRECSRVLSTGGLIMLAFHIGDEVVHVDDLFGQKVSLDFRFHQPRDVMRALASNRLTVIESTERAPYEGREHQSRRAYILARKD
jgi:ubiquinone/menaquinone biosynthesis C-methylase UbiE